MHTVSIFALVGATHCVLLMFVCLISAWPAKTSDKLLAAMLGLEGFRLFALVAFAEGEPGHLLRAESKYKTSILDIADQAGFNSPATFYKYFRKQTGKSPRRFLQEQVSAT